jgi:chemotaxis protein CheX
MSATKFPINRPAIITRTVKNVFETMVGLPVVPKEGTALPDLGEEILGTVGLASDTVAGSVHFHLSITFASEITERILGSPPQANGAINDAIGELTNMVAGALKSAYCDAGHFCVMSIPGIVRGSALTIRNMPSTTSERFLFACGPNIFAVEVHSQRTGEL